MNWLGLIPYLLAFAMGAGVAYPVARAPLQTDLANLRTEYAGLRETNAETIRLSALAAEARLKKAQATGEQASQRLAAALSANAQLSEEKKRAVKEATAGRACLSDRALRVLDGSTGITVAPRPAGVPAPAGQPPAAGAPAAADTRVATDSDVAGWVIDAGRQYEACREQLGGLIDWINKNTGTAAPPQEPLREPAK